MLPQPEVLNCLVANDDCFQLMMLKFNLNQAQINVIQQASNGFEVYQFLQKNINLLRLDFILLDIQMPIMDGFETCRKICELYDKDKKLFKMMPNKRI